MTKELTTAIIVDFMGHGFGKFTPEMEAEELQKQYEELLAPAKLDVYTPYSANPSELKDSTDLILFDYGGLLPGTSLAEDNSRRIIEWAENHPSCLVVVVSRLTFTFYIRNELEAKGLDGLPNLVKEWDFVEDGDNEPLGHPIPEWFRAIHNLPYIDPYAQEVRTLTAPK